MADTQHDSRTSENPATPQTEGSLSPESSAMTVARLLANPRRTRRD